MLQLLVRVVDKDHLDLSISHDLTLMHCGLLNKKEACEYAYQLVDAAHDLIDNQDTRYRLVQALDGIQDDIRYHNDTM